MKRSYSKLHRTVFFKKVSSMWQLCYDRILSLLFINFVIIVKELTLSDIKKATNKLQEKLISKCGTPDEISKSEDLIQQLRIKYEESVDTYFKDLEVIFDFILL